MSLLLCSHGGSSASHGTRVYIGNLSYHVTWQQLKDHMRKSGDVIRADVMVGIFSSFPYHLRCVVHDVQYNRVCVCVCVCVYHIIDGSQWSIERLWYN
jgi:hypothetical protein